MVTLGEEEEKEDVLSLDVRCSAVLAFTGCDSAPQAGGDCEGVHFPLEGEWDLLSSGL